MMAVVNNVDKKEQKVKNAFKLIVRQGFRRGYMDEARLYAKAGYDLDLTGESLKVQALYVLNNLQHWRGDEARRCKKVLKEFGGGR